MGKISQADIPGNMLTFTLACASIASEAVASDGTYRPAFVAPADGTIISVYTLASTSQAAGTSTTQTIKLINVGAAGAGTTVLASVDSKSSAGIRIPRAFSVVSDNSFSAGDALVWVFTTSESNGVNQNACEMTVTYRLT